MFKFETKSVNTPLLKIVVAHFQNVLKKKKTVYKDNRYGPIGYTQEINLVLKVH